MDAERWEKIKDVFDGASDLDGVSRREYLDRACVGDAELRVEVERLLGEFDQAGDFLNTPVVDVAALSPVVAGRYRVVRQVGRGGMGEVYEAKDQLMGETVALKTLRPEFVANQSVIDRFQKEILLARKVTHPNVCRVFEAGVHQGTGMPFFTMEFLEGETLAARINRQGRLTRDQAFHLIPQMADGLQAAHEAGVIHRDFKSGNVMVCGGERAVITDFGLARFRPLDSGGPGDMTMASNARLAGTVGYMSPEQMTGGDITGASDIYSFGVVLFEMAAGKLPFDERHLINSAVQRASGEIPWIRSEVPDIDPLWESAITRCLQPDPKRRFRSARELGDHFRGTGWRFQVPRMTRRAYVGGGVLVAAAGGFLYWSTRPYEPLAEARGWFQKGVEQVHAMMFESARRALEKSVAIDPNYAPAHAYLAMAYGELDYSERAKESALRAATAAQASRVTKSDGLRILGWQHFAAHDYGVAQPHFAELVTRAGAAERVAALLELGLVARRADDFDTALRATGEAVGLDPSHAGAWLLRAVLLAQRRKGDDPVAAFSKAETLFSTSSNHEGVTETLLQRAIYHSRATQPALALAVIEKALPIAKATEDVIHQIRLELAMALAYRNLNEIEKSKESAAAATARAVASGHDVWASVGLLDLGNAHFRRGEPEIAEKYFLQGVEYAQRQKWRFPEARGLLSLASLRLQYGRTAEGVAYAGRAIPFLREGKHRRELLQGLAVMGALQCQLADFGGAAKSLQEAIAGFDEAGDAQQGGVARSRMVEVLTKTGDWRAALEMNRKSIELRQKATAKDPALHGYLARAILYGKLGQVTEAESTFDRVAAGVAALSGEQAQIRCALAAGRAEYLYSQRRWKEAGAYAEQALAVKKGAAEDLEMARMVAGLVAYRAGRGAAGKGLLGAEAMLEKGAVAEAKEAARAALGYYVERGIWEGAWRCRTVMGDPGAGADRDRFREMISAELFAGYVSRPDVKKVLV
jgi:tetratricopeptide (TPR) repeat protein